MKDFIPLKTRQYISGKSILHSIPKVLNIELTNICNLRCSVCIDNNGSKKGFMDIALLKKIIEENREVLHDQSVWLHFSGESLIHPEIDKIIRLLKTNEIRCRLSTNATLLTEKKSAEIMQSGLDYIVFSVDGASKETYERIRIGANFEEVENNILNFLKIKKENNYKIKTQIQFIKMKENEHELKSFLEKWKKTSVNYINIKSFSTRAWNVNNIGNFGNVNKLKSKKKKRYPCFYLWETLIVLWNGDVVPCCQDLAGRLKVGNISDNNLLEIWNNQTMTKLRKLQDAGDYSMCPCDNCPDWKGFRRNSLLYICNSMAKNIFQKVLKREFKDEGIKIISNKND
jgi:radical SAM protein with 4Fe4S-binding SPASM domain